MALKSILYIVCPNGQGHLKRSLEIAEICIQSNRRLSFSWFLSEKHQSIFRRKASPILFKNSTCTTFANEDGLSITSLSTKEFPQSFGRWFQALRELIVRDHFDLVLSDNICSPLSLNSHCILIGSFFWHDVIPINDNNKEVLEQEAVLAQSQKPTMLYLGNMVMEAVRNGTHGIPLPWFTTKYPGPSQIAKKPQVLISAGLSGDNFDLFLEIAKILSDNPAFDLQVDKKMYDLLGVAGVELFDFTKLAFSKLSLIICRPGIGILTDAVCFNIPLLTGCSFTNKEMIHNANRIEQLGIGKKVDLRNFKLLEKEIKVLLEPTGVRLTMVKKLETQPTGGAQAAAEFINTRLAN